MPKECNGQRSKTNVNGANKNNTNEDSVKNVDRSFAVLNGKGIVDGGSFMPDMRNNKFLEEDIKPKCWSHRRKSDVARERWKLLAKALLKPKKNSSKTVRDISVRRFTSFDLVTPNKLGEYPTDYWVSQARKYCESCKCYISANKASIDFHENGKNHQENLAKRLIAMQKKAAKEQKEATKFQNEMKKIEAAALRAYAKDVETNPDIASQTMGEITIPEPEVPEAEPPRRPQAYFSKRWQNKVSQPKPKKRWMEAISKDGTNYFWNLITGESTWEVPDEGFVSLEEQELAKKTAKNPSLRNKKKFGKNAKSFSSKNKVVIADLPIVRPHLGSPFGKWKVVTKKEETKVDLQLPKQDSVKVEVLIPKEEETKFEEKKIPIPGSIASTSGEVQFKKRKTSTDPKKNLRQRSDSD